MKKTTEELIDFCLDKAAESKKNETRQIYIDITKLLVELMQIKDRTYTTPIFTQQPSITLTQTPIKNDDTRWHEYEVTCSNCSEGGCLSDAVKSSNDFICSEQNKEFRNEV